MIKPKQQQGIIIWEKKVYCQVPGKGWLVSQPARLEDAAALIQEYYKPKSRLMLLYDPDILQTEYTEAPGGGRMIAREALSNSYETIGNMHTGWGLQEPWPIPGSGGAFSTFCSYETTISLYPLISTLRDHEYVINRAFPFTSLAMSVAGTPGRTHIFIVVDHSTQAYVYLHTASGVRAVRKLYAGKNPENYDVWAEISLVFGEYGVTFDDGGQRPQIRIYQAPETDVKTQCPYWDVLQEQSQVELMNFDALLKLLGTLPGNHISSLIADMPRFISFDLGLKISSAVLGLALLGLIGYSYMTISDARREIGLLEMERNKLQMQKQRLESNKRDMEKLQQLYSQDLFEMSTGRLKLIELLPTAIPREATLTGVNMGLGGGANFRLKGVFWNQNIGASQPQRGSSASNTTPLTDVIRTLETSVSGLLTTPAASQLQQTGDFTIEGTTPLPESLSKGESTSSQQPLMGNIRGQLLR